MVEGLGLRVFRMSWCLLWSYSTITFRENATSSPAAFFPVKRSIIAPFWGRGMRMWFASREYFAN